MREMTMRSSFAYVLVAVAVVATGCKNDDESGPLAADARWQLRCPTGSLSCFDQRPEHAISAREGDSDAVVGCEFIPISGGSRVLMMEFVEPTGSLEVENVVVNASGGVLPSPDCSVTVIEGAGIEGIVWGPHACGPNVPSAEQPCQITTLAANAAGTLALDDGTVEGKIFSTTVECIDIETNAGTEPRQLVSPDAPPPNLMPAPITVANCDGY